MDEQHPYQPPNESSPFAPPHQVDDGTSGMITTLAVVNYVFGGFQVFCGLCIAAMGGTIFGALGIDQSDPDVQMGAGIFSAIVIVIGIVTIILGLPTLLAGYGIQKRAQWGRILTIVLAVISGFFAVAQGLQLSPGAILSGGYAIFALVILFDEKYAKHFN